MQNRTIHFGSRGRASGDWLVFLGTVVLLVGLGYLLVSSQTRKRGQSLLAPLVMHCAAGIKIPVEEIALNYQKEFGVPIQLQYGGSQSLLAGIEVAKRGDLFLPADESYLKVAIAKGLVAETIPAARMTAVLAVRKGNPKNIRGVEDLLKEGILLAQANPEAAAIGKMVRDTFQKTGQWEPLKQKTTVFKPTVNDVANDLKLGTVDAGFIWDGMLKHFPELETVACPQLINATTTIMIGVLNCTAQPTSALRFARYLSAHDKGQTVFVRHGYKDVAGDPWAETPELRLLSGAMLRPAIEETLKKFEQREGIKITTVYNGCGILVAQMRAGERPDAYFSCDRSFMQQVNDLFIDPEDFAKNLMVVLTHKGNPKNIKGLKDLGNPGLKVGLAHEQQSALGALTQRMLQAAGVYEVVRKNVAVESATGDFLVNQLRAGSLDAVVVYISNSAKVREHVEVIEINQPEAIATQPLAVCKEARYPRLAARLKEVMKKAESRSEFEKIGFTWVFQATNSKQ